MSDWQEAEQHVERAHEHYEAGRWEDAAAELRRALALNPYQAEWHFNLGLTLDAAGRHSDAAVSFGRASDLSPEDVRLAVMTGSSLLRAGHVEQSLSWFERAANVDGADPASFVHRIEAYARLGRFDQAELMFFMGQQTAPDCAELYASMAEALMDQGQYERAVWCLREAARLEPEMPRCGGASGGGVCRDGSSRESAAAVSERAAA
ncbi:MAG: tetratricopeptide repeat protein [Phycisphaeraceae bacterium]|nr:tetratricopeptide repeat protein [Phycisphaeraceae bacterium]